MVCRKGEMATLWLQFLAATGTVIWVVIVLPKERRPLPMMLLAGMVWLFSAQLVAGKYFDGLAMIAGLHPFWVWLPFSAASAAVVGLLTVAPKEKRTFFSLALACFAWLWAAWLMIARYPSIQSWAWRPFLSIIAGLLLGMFVYLFYMSRRAKQQAAGHGAGVAGRRDGDA